MTIQNVSILDCTFRDGGYYTDWCFDAALASEYLKSIAEAGVEVVEIGFRFAASRGFLGPYAFSQDEFLSGLDIPEELSVAVMVNCSDLVCRNSGDLDSSVLNRLFPRESSRSPVSMVRIAAHMVEIEVALKAAAVLKGLGFSTAINLMQIGECEPCQIEEFAQRACDNESVDILYFADSLGNLKSEDVLKIVRQIRSNWRGPLGFHAHDNMGRALDNCLAAIDAGVTWIDSTITGMGRGAGNVCTETLLIELNDERLGLSRLKRLIALAGTSFSKMKSEEGWGVNCFYYLSAQLGIHPTYVQEMLGDDNFDSEAIISALTLLQSNGGKKFSYENLNGVRNHHFLKSHKGTWNPRKELCGKEVILIGTGESSAIYADAIIQWIIHKKPLVFSLNADSPIPAEYVDYYIACHPIKMASQIDKYKRLTKTLITPIGALEAEMKDAINSIDSRDFGMSINPSELVVHETECEVPITSVFAYSMCVFVAGEAARVFMVGFDGYPSGDERMNEMLHILNCFEQLQMKPALTSLTPTKYPVSKSSIYFYG